MRGFSPETSFGPEVAAHDDEPRGDEEAAVTFLADLAAGGTALELAVGTGRIALPLADQGVEVHGIELSEAMVDRLREKPGGRDLPVWLGDMVAVSTGQRYDVVYLVFNTIFNLLTQDAQVDCFVNAARHLEHDGAFVVEAGVPGAWIGDGAYARPERVEADAVTLDVCSYDPVAQVLDENHVQISADGIRFGPISCRLAWPSELDLMARIAGLELAERSGGWHRQPYTGRDQHVSVYRRAD